MKKTKKEYNEFIKRCEKKIIDTIQSCKNEEQYKLTENLIINFYNNICDRKKIVYNLFEYLQEERFLKLKTRKNENTI